MNEHGLLFFLFFLQSPRQINGSSGRDLFNKFIKQLEVNKYHVFNNQIKGMPFILGPFHHVYV